MRRRLARAGIISCMTVLVAACALAYPYVMRGSEWAGVSWRHPIALGLLALVPLLLWRGTWGEDARTPRLRLGLLQPLVTGPRGVRARLRDLPGVVRAVALGMMIVALAGPVSTARHESAEELGIDIVLVLDLSGSMRAVMDAPLQTLPGKHKPGAPRPTRLDTAKEVIRDFIARRKSDRIGVVVFGKDAYVLSPPTLDYQLLDSLVSRMSLELIDGNATAIGDALGVAVARMRKSDARSKTVVLLTDGDSNAGAIAPEYAAHLATVVGARVYTIQIGIGDDVEVQQGVDLLGYPRYVKTRFPVNPELLGRISSTTGGVAYVATDAQALQRSMHDVLDRLEKTRFEAISASYEDLFPLLLLPASLLVALDAMLRAWILRRFP